MQELPVREDLRDLQRPTAESVGFGLYGDDRNHGTAGNNQRKLNYEKVHDNGQRKRSARNKNGGPVGHGKSQAEHSNNSDLHKLKR